MINNSILINDVLNIIIQYLDTYYLHKYIKISKYWETMILKYHWKCLNCKKYNYSDNVYNCCVIKGICESCLNNLNDRKMLYIIDSNHDYRIEHYDNIDKYILNNNTNMNLNNIITKYKGIPIYYYSYQKYDGIYNPYKINNYWFNFDTKHTLRNMQSNIDILHQIKVDINTSLIISNGTDVCKINLIKDKPYILNIPVRHIQYSEVYLIFNPPVNNCYYNGILDNYIDKYIQNKMKFVILKELNIFISSGSLIKFKI